MTSCCQIAVLPPDGVVPLADGDSDELPVGHDHLPEAGGQHPGNAIAKTPEVLDRGRELFTRFCVVCHGAAARGDGPVGDPYPAPPSLLDVAAIRLLDTNIHRYITLGRNRMPAYGAQISPADRWRVVHHVRNLQPDLPADEATPSSPQEAPEETPPAAAQEQGGAAP